jgi:ATP-dependent RNA helicase RhlE
MKSFADFDILPTLHASLKELGFTKPTAIQVQTMPILLSGRSVVGVAETGGGKTLAYSLPLLHQIKSLEIAGEPVSENGYPRAAVIVPTRELGEQVSKVLKSFTHTTRLRVRTVLGGTTMEVARRNVNGIFEILVATPGRLVQLMDKNLLSLSDVRTLVFDEADQMLDQGFLDNAKQIIRACPDNIQMSLFSATISATVQELITTLFKDAQVIRSQGSHHSVPTLTTENLFIKDGKRFPVLQKLLKSDTSGGTLIFTNTREQCDKVSADLQEGGHSCVIYRGEMDKVERRRNLKFFRDGKVKLLISTDLASRGLDVDHVERVINYHLPKQIENYIHRVGRTARAGREGLVINFVTERDQPLMNQVEKSFSVKKRK